MDRTGLERQAEARPREPCGTANLLWAWVYSNDLSQRTSTIEPQHSRLITGLKGKCQNS